MSTSQAITFDQARELLLPFERIAQAGIRGDSEFVCGFFAARSTLYETVGEQFSMTTKQVTESMASLAAHRGKSQ